MDILMGLTKATNDNFTRPFKLLKDVSNQTIIDLGHLKSKMTLERIKTYLSQALDSYVDHVHVVNSTWKIKAIHAFTGEFTCWNCGKTGHDLRSCSEPCNQDRFPIFMFILRLLSKSFIGVSPRPVGATPIPHQLVTESVF